MRSNRRTIAKSTPVVPASLRRKLDRYFLARSVTLGATVTAVAAAADQAKGDIVYSGVRNISIPFNDLAGIYFDFDTGTTSTSVIAGVSDMNLFDLYSTTYANNKNYYYHGLFFLGPNGTTNSALAIDSATNDLTLKLAAGATIGPNPATGGFSNFNELANQYYNYTTHAKAGSLKGMWTTTGTGYIGFRFKDKNGQTDYGWMRLNLNIPNFFNQTISATVIDWAYSNTGGPISAGQVPEPSSVALSLLGGGALGLSLWRKLRRQKKQSPEA